MRTSLRLCAAPVLFALIASFGLAEKRYASGHSEKRKSGQLRRQTSFDPPIAPIWRHPPI
jgi:hypothetical protein